MLIHAATLASIVLPLLMMVLGAVLLIRASSLSLWSRSHSRSGMSLGLDSAVFIRASGALIVVVGLATLLG